MVRIVGFEPKGRWASSRLEPRAGRHGGMEMTHAEIERTMAETGLTRYLGANAFGAHRVRRALQQACAHGEGNQVVWETP